MSGIDFVAAPRICPPGARAKVFILFFDRPLAQAGSACGQAAAGWRYRALKFTVKVRRDLSGATRPKTRRPNPSQHERPISADVKSHRLLLLETRCAFADSIDSPE